MPSWRGASPSKAGGVQRERGRAKRARRGSASGARARGSEPRYVERDQGGHGRAAHCVDAESAQHENDPGGQRTGGTIQSGRHGETSTGYDWFGQTSSYPVVAPFGFRVDQSLYRVSPVT